MNWNACRIAGVAAAIGCLISCATAPPPAAPHSVIKGRYQAHASGELDRAEEPLKVTADAAAAAVGGDVFRGTAREAAKTSIATAELETFDTIVKLRKSLESDRKMRDREPPISSHAGSDRVDVEIRNVAVRAYIFAIKKEHDRDFHVIVGDEKCRRAKCFLNVEVSGWPESTTHPDRPALKTLRARFLAFFEDGEPGNTSGYDKYSPPVPVVISGSLFFDVDHSSGTIGPQCCRPSTAWEIHPVTEIEFEPD